MVSAAAGSAVIPTRARLDADLARREKGWTYIGRGSAADKLGESVWKNPFQDRD